MGQPLPAPVLALRRPYRVIFTHVPKVAGTSLMRRLVRANYASGEIREFCGVRDLLRDRTPFGALVGHSVYGMHHFVSADCRYFTMLRDPQARAVSHYFFIKQPTLQGIDRNAAQSVLHNRVGLADIFEHTRRKRFRLMGTWLIDNMQTRYIAGWTQHWRGPASGALLAAAKRNLRDNFSAFGLQDRFDESIQRIAGAFDWDIGPDTGHRAKQTRIEKTVTEAELESVRRNNLLDFELHDYAQELFRQRAMAI